LSAGDTRNKNTVLASRRSTVLAFGALALIWGSSFPLVKVGLQHSPPLLFAGLRALLGGLALVLAGQVWGDPPDLRREWSAALISALFNVVLFVGLQTLAILYVPSGLAAVLVYLQPIGVGLLAWLFVGEPLFPAKVAGLFLGFAGVAVVSAGGLSGHVSLAGVATGALAGLSWAIGTVYFKRVQERVSMLWFVAFSFVAGGVILTLAGLAFESYSEIEWSSTGFLASLLFVSLAGVTLAWILWLQLVATGEASRVSAYIFFVPLTSVIIGTVLLGEPFDLFLIGGAALILSGIYLVNRPQQAKR
jgi:O-acetylserine/cysteine efflux transporter